MGAPKNVFDVVNRRNNKLQRGIKIIVEAFWQRKIFDLEIVKYFNLSKCLTYLPWLIDKPSIKLTDTPPLASLKVYQYVYTPSK